MNKIMRGNKYFTLIISVFFYECCSVSCAIINSPTSHHVNNIISKDTKNVTVLEIPIDNNAEIVAIQPIPDEKIGEYGHKQEKSNPLEAPMKITIPMTYHKKVLTSIVHPLPRTMHDMMPKESPHPTYLDHKKLHDDFLKHEVPILQKKLHHHYTVEEMRQKRREIKEKWQARHKKHSIDMHDEKNKNKVKPKEKLHKRKEKDENKADLYEQVTPHSSSVFDSEFRDNSKINKTKVNHKYAKRSIDTINSMRSKFSEEFGPIQETPDMNNARNWGELGGTQLKPEAENEIVGGIEIYPGMENDQVTVRIDTPPFYRNLTYDEKILIQRPLWGAGKSAEEVGNQLEPGTENELVGGIEVYPGMEKDQITIRIDTPPFYRNLTHEEKILIQGPLWGAGKAAEEVPEAQLEPGNDNELVGGIEVYPGMEKDQITIRIDTPPFYRNLTHEEKILIQGPLWGAGKAADEIPEEQLETGRENELVGGIEVYPGMEKDQITIRIDTPPFYRNLTHEEKILIQGPLWGAGKAADEIPEEQLETGRENELVGGIEVYPGMEKDQITIRIDTPPFYRNLTHEEKILIQGPLWGAGKAADEIPEEQLETGRENELVGGIEVYPGMEKDQITIRIDTPPFYRNLTHEEKILIQGPLWGAGKSAEN